MVPFFHHCIKGNTVWYLHNAQLLASTFVSMLFSTVPSTKNTKNFNFENLPIFFNFTLYSGSSSPIVSEISSKNWYQYISIWKLVISISSISISNQKLYLFSGIRYITLFLQNKMDNVLILLCFLCEWIAILPIDVDEMNNLLSEKVKQNHIQERQIQTNFHLDHLAFSAFLFKKFLILISFSDIEISVFHEI